MKTTRTPTLEERIRQIRADIEAIVDARVELVAKESPGVPSGVIRNLLTARAPACPCAQYLELDTRQAGRLPVTRISKMTLYKWSQTAAGNATADLSINWQEGQAPSSVNDSGARDDGIDRQASRRYCGSDRHGRDRGSVYGHVLRGVRHARPS